MNRSCIAVAAAVAALAGPGAAPALAGTGCQTRACNERVAMKRCSQDRPRWCVERAILHRRFTGWAAAWMRRIPGCESGWDPYAQNPSGSSGLYQFQPETWAGTPYGRRSIWSAKWQSLAAAWMVVQGRTREWVCR